MSDERTHDVTPGPDGWITHTDLASNDPDATRAWCAEVFGWERGSGPGEQPGSTPTVHVADTQRAYDAALAAGAEGVSPPTTVTQGVCVATVREPGGVLLGLSGPTDGRR